MTRCLIYAVKRNTYLLNPRGRVEICAPGRALPVFVYPNRHVCEFRTVRQALEPVHVSVWRGHRPQVVTISERGAPKVGDRGRTAGRMAGILVSTSLRARTAPVAAVMLGVVTLGLGVASVVVDHLIHRPGTSGPAADAFIAAAGVVPATAVGTLLAARRPGTRSDGCC